MINRGLIIKEKWANKILNKDKSIEIRGSSTKNIGRIGIIISGTKQIYGEATLYKAIRLNEETYYKLKDKHKLDISYEELLKTYKKPHAWYLKDVKKYNKPKPYNHKPGCVIWVKI